MLAAGLLGLAAAVLVLPPTTTRRLQGLVPDSRRTSSTRTANGLPPTWMIFGCAGLVAWWVFGGLLGAGAGVALVLGGPRLLARLDDRGEKEADELTRDLPLALDLLGACLAGGGSLAAALGSVAGANGGACGARLERVAAALAVGSPPDDAFRELGTTGAAGAAARALCRASEGGAPVASAVARVAEEARRHSLVQARKRAKRAGVLAVGPLGICFLPAFVLLGVVPAIVGLASPLLASL